MLKHYVEYHKKECHPGFLWDNQSLEHDTIEEKEVIERLPQKVVTPWGYYGFRFFDRIEMACGPDGEELFQIDDEFFDCQGEKVPTEEVEILQGKKRNYSEFYYVEE